MIYISRNIFGHLNIHFTSSNVRILFWMQQKSLLLAIWNIDAKTIATEIDIFCDLYRLCLYVVFFRSPHTVEGTNKFIFHMFHLKCEVISSNSEDVLVTRIQIYAMFWHVSYVSIIHC